jgi:hypothetical protein
MARIKMITMLAGPDGTMHPGKSYDVDDDLALTLAAANACELLESALVVPPEIPAPETKAVETATKAAPENAARRSGRGSRS